MFCNLSPPLLLFFAGMNSDLRVALEPSQVVGVSRKCTRWYHQILAFPFDTWTRRRNFILIAFRHIGVKEAALLGEAEIFWYYIDPIVHGLVIPRFIICLGVVWFEIDRWHTDKRNLKKSVLSIKEMSIQHDDERTFHFLLLIWYSLNTIIGLMQDSVEYVSPKLMIVYDFFVDNLEISS